MGGDPVRGQGSGLQSDHTGSPGCSQERRSPRDRRPAAVRMAVSEPDRCVQVSGQSARPLCPGEWSVSQATVSR